MATHSRILAWDIPWTEEPGGYTLWGRKKSDMIKHEQKHTQYYTVYLYHIFIHRSVNKYLGCFHVLAIVNSASMNIGVHVSF